VVVAGPRYATSPMTGLKAPPQPIAFLKAYGALIGANDPIRYPPLTKNWITRLNWWSPSDLLR
jgi:2-keto-4-pentenoate hydratase/2-oxohepta-3-ene-1,7-dioic acid hydratase in catechol pathway